MKFSYGIIIQFLITIMMKVTLSHPAEGINLFDFFMSSSGQHSHNISFSPDDGKKFRRSFEQKYGPKGKDLIESLGHGSSAFPEVTSKLATEQVEELDALLKIVKVAYSLTLKESLLTSLSLLRTNMAIPVKNFTKVVKKKRKITPTLL